MTSYRTVQDNVFPYSIYNNSSSSADYLLKIVLSFGNVLIW